jgi:hypothetical protein
MATLQTTEEFRKAIAYLQSVDHFGSIVLQMGIGDTVAECFVLDDETLTVITPDTATLEAALDSANATIVTSNTIQAAKQSILDLANKADNHAPRIALCFAAILESENLGEDADATFLRITTALNNVIVSNGYRTAVMTAFTAKHGLSFSFADVGIVILTTRQSFNRFSAEFFTRWAFMVNLR